MDCYYYNSCKSRQCDEGGCVSCMRQFKLDFLLDKSLLPEAQKYDIRLFAEDIDEKSYNELGEIRKNIKSFVQGGNNLYIYSNIPGNGKTSWAIKLMKEYLYKIWPEAQMTCKVLFINVPKFLLALKANISKQSDYISYINEFVNDVDLIVWDDIGTKSATEFEHEHLLSIIDSRLIEGKSNIFTSNMNPERLLELVGERLTSRIVNPSIQIEFKGADKRGVRISDLLQNS